MFLVEDSPAFINGEGPVVPLSNLTRENPCFGVMQSFGSEMLAPPIADLPVVGGIDD
ncbi:MAG: hypothetical protein R3C18_02710 [Planctomycetaceae bacterium]